MSESDYQAAIDELAPRVLHGLEDEAGRTELSRLLATSAANRRRFLDHVSLHAMLAQEAKAGAFAENKLAFFDEMGGRPPSKVKRFTRLWIPAAAAVIVASLLILPLLPTTAVAALDRVIKAENAGHDRTYRIEVLEAGSGDAPERRDDRGRFPVGNHLDGATMWLRGPGEFVLRQKLPDGSTRVMGCDASGSWSLRGSGPVHVSDNPGRFGGWVFSKSGEFAFLDLRSQLEELRRFYQIESLDRSDRNLWKLHATRLSSNERGPRDVELWFDPQSGLLERMILRQLPRGNGGPRSIGIVLQSSDPLPPSFFSHDHHHESGRAVLKEPDR
jgi:hypothetical protein